MENTKLPAYKLAKMLIEKKITSVELTKACLQKVQENSSLNAYITVTEELAIKQAVEADKRIQSNKTCSKLDGIPIAIKDNYLTKGIRTTNASSFYIDFIPPYESTVTQKVQNAGLVCIGKTNMDEFAMGSDSTTSYFGPTINPWSGLDKTNKVPGGSSGGSAAAVSANTVPFALGTDTGGSVRQPAAFCGVVGLKPTYGMCSRYGIFSFASSLDQAGILSSNVIDNALLLEIIAGYDKNDSTMVNKTSNFDFTTNIQNLDKEVTVGIIREYEHFNTNYEIKEAYENTVNIIKSLGINIKFVSFPRAEYVLPVYYIIAPVEAMSNYSRYDGVRYGKRIEGNKITDIYQNSRSKGFGIEVKSRILMGTYSVLQENFDVYIKACKIRSLVAKDFQKMFEEVDFILTPTTSTTAFDLSSSSRFTPLEKYYNDIFTVSVNLAGLPAISLPISLSKNKMPIGIQLIGNYYDEINLYKVSYKLEQEVKFDKFNN